MTPAVAIPRSPDMTREERSNLILAFARVLYINGESTDKTLDAAERLGNFLGLRTTVFPRWAELAIQTEDSDGKSLSAIDVSPSGVEMDRVASTRRTIDDLCSGRLALSSAMEAINKIARTPPAPT